MSDFATALALVLKEEGGISHDPHDRGGATNFGVTQRTYDAWRGLAALPRRTVDGIEQAEVSAIYRTQYADAVCFDDLPSGVDYCVFDAAVNSGPVRAIRWLQSALGVEVDGHFGLVTMRALSTSTPSELIDRICDSRLGFMRHLSAWLHFRTGWTRRVEFVRQNALKLAAVTKPQAASQHAR